MGKSFAALLLATVLASAPAVVRGDGMPSPEHSIVSWNLGEGQSATLLVMPDGGGPPFTAARDPGGAVVDATIRMVLKDYSGALIANFAAEDMWIESLDQGLVFCAGGSRADHNTDMHGVTSWTLPRRAGGWSQTQCRVIMNGQPVTGGIDPPHAPGILDEETAVRAEHDRVRVVEGCLRGRQAVAVEGEAAGAGERADDAVRADATDPLVGRVRDQQAAVRRLQRHQPGIAGAVFDRDRHAEHAFDQFALMRKQRLSGAAHYTQRRQPGLNIA